MTSPTSTNYGMPAPVPTLSTSPHKASEKLKAGGGGNKKGTSAERRATHNAVERARRESLNVRFLELAANLPATCTVRRPSKSLIVNQSLDFVRTSLNNDTILRLKVDELLKQNQTVMEELNSLRQERGLSPRAMTVEIELPLPLAERDFTSKSRRANLALSRGSFSLGGDFDDDQSGQASNSPTSSTGSPQEGLHASGLTASSVNGGYHPSPNLSDSAPYYLDAAQPFGGDQSRQTPASFSSLPPSAYFAHGPSVHQQHHTHHQPSSDYMPPITPTTAAMFSQIMSSSYPTEAGASHNGISVEDSNHSAFAAMASNTFFDHRYSNAVSTPNSGSYTTAA